MEKDELVLATQEGLSIRGIAKRFGKSGTAVRYWLSKYSLRTDPRPRGRSTCIVCERPTKNNRSRCAGCWTKLRRYTCKVMAIEMLGGACKRCGWKGSVAGFSFHHRNDDKSFEIGQIANKSWKVVKAELVKCDLLCLNCHSILHSNMEGTRFLAEAALMLERRRVSSVR